MPVTIPVRIDAPARTPRRGGLLAVANVQDAASSHAAFGVEFQTFELCGDFGNGLWAAPCGSDVPGLAYDTEKEFSGPQVITGSPFGVYAGVECDLLGTYGAEARARLESGEELTVSTAYYGLLGPEFADAGNQIGTFAPGNTVGAIAALEQAAATRYGGLPIIHMSPFNASLAVSQQAAFLDPLTGVLFTGLGTPIAVGAGYPGDRIWATGSVHIWRTPVRTYDVPDVRTNTAQTLAERIYVIATDCFIGFLQQGAATQGDQS